MKTCLIYILVFLFSSSIYGSTIFTEDFEKGGNPQSIKTTVYGWVNTNADMSITDSTPLNGYAADGSTATVNFHNIFIRLLPQQISTNSNTVFIFNSYAKSWTGAYSYTSHNSGIGLANESTYLLAWTAIGYYDENAWRFDVRGITGNSSAYEDITGYNDEKVTVKIYIDYLSGKCWGEIADDTKSQLTQKYSITDFTAIDRLFINEDRRTFWELDNTKEGYGIGIDIDNIVLTSSIPVVKGVVIEIHG